MVNASAWKSEWLYLRSQQAIKVNRREKRQLFLFRQPQKIQLWDFSLRKRWSYINKRKKMFSPLYRERRERISWSLSHFRLCVINVRQIFLSCSKLLSFNLWLQYECNGNRNDHLFILQITFKIKITLPLGVFSPLPPLLSSNLREGRLNKGDILHYLPWLLPLSFLPCLTAVN